MSLKHAILVMLETEPSSGYDLIKHFKSSMGYFWNARHQQVYQQLKQLHDDGLVDCDLEPQAGKPDKKVYAINPRGIEALKEWLHTPVKQSKVNDALLVKLYGGHLANDQELLDELDRHIAVNQQTLTELLAIEAQYLSLPANKQARYRLPYITLRRGILSERAWLAWADEAKAAIKK